MVLCILKRKLEVKSFLNEFLVFYTPTLKLLKKLYGLSASSFSSEELIIDLSGEKDVKRKESTRGCPL
ncbi:hypothetical protein A946_01895 [Methylacidiphilum kamchatkense Kam1]|uniref:Uncharacterized protein n=1 Tax=Methylacidiphilum kamchatkense Kam1 TaxID=1202785 RepID=A0A0C1UUL5_9BACT|nr:hypothetical protein A946_01895 [Methylacidiphilum kamchatkense Kam1]QDQ42552.1 hypothetical protein kam1_1327 [Methylacidiphilum kamchatkense Kam1]